MTDVRVDYRAELGFVNSKNSKSLLRPPGLLEQARVINRDFGLRVLQAAIFRCDVALAIMDLCVLQSFSMPGKVAEHSWPITYSRQFAHRSASAEHFRKTRPAAM